MEVWVVGILVFVAVLCICILARLFDLRPRQVYPKKILKSIKTLVTEAAQSGELSEKIKDSDPLLKIVHAVYGKAYLEAARSMMYDGGLSKLMRYPISDLNDSLQKQYVASVMATKRKCPVLENTTALSVAANRL